MPCSGLLVVTQVPSYTASVALAVAVDVMTIRLIRKVLMRHLILAIIVPPLVADDDGTAQDSLDRYPESMAATFVPGRALQAGLFDVVAGHVSLQKKGSGSISVIA